MSAVLISLLSRVFGDRFPLSQPILCFFLIEFNTKALEEKNKKITKPLNRFLSI